MKPLLPISLLAGTAIWLSGCATTQLTPQYIPPSTYQSYDCTQLLNERQRVERYITNTRQQQSTLSTTGVGVGVSAGRGGIYPNISFGIGKSQNTQARDAKLSRLYGERDAIIQAGRIQRCQWANGLKVYGE